MYFTSPQHAFAYHTAHIYTVVNDLSKAIVSNHEVASSVYQEFLSAHIEPAATFEQLTQALSLNADFLKQNDARSSTDGCLQSPATKSASELGGVDVKNAITRDMMIHKLRELKYDSLAVALETGTLKKLDPTPVIMELRNLHASLKL